MKPNAFFSNTVIAAKTRTSKEWRTHCQFATLDYHRFFSFFFSFALKHFSTFILLCLWAKTLNTLTSKYACWPDQSPRNWVHWYRDELLYFCLLPVENLHYWLLEKKSSRGVFRKRCSENMQQIYTITPMPKSDFNKVEKQLKLNFLTCCFATLLKSHFGMDVLL